MIHANVLCGSWKDKIQSKVNCSSMPSDSLDMVILPAGLGLIPVTEYVCIYVSPLRREKPAVNSC